MAKKARSARAILSSFFKGETLGDKYLVGSVIGHGGMAVVVEARHVLLDEPVAIKILRDELVDQTELIERFLREARASAKIKNEHVVRVTDVARTDDGTPYMVMEHLEGEDLSKALSRTGPLPLRDAIEYVLQVCEGLAEAHAIGIYHRDLKPGNLFLTRRRNGVPVVKILDFGISKYVREDMTHSSESFGTPSYMSPEQIQSAKHVDGRTDIWALGCVLYKLLTGVTPFRSEGDTHVTHFILTAPALPPSTLRPDIPLSLDKAVMGCLEKHVEKRFSSVVELMAALESALHDIPAEAAQPSSDVMRRQTPVSARDAKTIAGLGQAMSPHGVAPGTLPQTDASSASASQTPQELSRTPLSVLDASPVSQTHPMLGSEEPLSSAASSQQLDPASSGRESITTTLASIKPTARSPMPIALIALLLLLLLAAVLAVMWSFLHTPSAEPELIPLPASASQKLPPAEETP